MTDTIKTLRDALEALEDYKKGTQISENGRFVTRVCCGTPELTRPHHESCKSVQSFYALRTLIATMEAQQPVAFLYTLEYGGNVVDSKTSIDQLNYPFGVCGADYIARNDDGVSYVRQTKLYAAPVDSVATSMAIPLTDEAVSAAAKRSGFNMEPTANALFTVRGNHAQLVAFAREFAQPLEAQQGQEPVGVLRITMESHDNGQSLEKSEPFKYASAIPTKAGQSLPLGEYALYAAPVQPVEQPKAEPCTWHQIDDTHMPGTWDADCGAMWTFTDGGPVENDMRYCPKCGKPVAQEGGAA